MPPPRRSYATPEETFGITRKPLNDWLDFAASGLPRQGPAFSTELEDAGIDRQKRELEKLKLQRDLASEQAATKFMSDAAGKKPQGLMRLLAESPEIIASENAPMIRDYVTMQQQAQQLRKANQPFSNKVLGPALMKGLEPEDQAALADLMEQGYEATEAMSQIKSQKAEATQMALRQKTLLEALKEGAIDEADYDAIRSSDDPERAMAAAMGRKKLSGGKSGAVSVLDESDKLISIIGKLEEMGDAERADKFRKRLDAISLAESNPSTGAIVPQSAFDAAQATAMGAPAVADVVTPAAVPELTVAPQRPLSAFEADEAKRVADRAASEAMAAQELNAAWTGAKDAPVTRVPAAEGTQPQRLMNLAKAAVVGEPIQGATKQEQQLAQLMADYAARAAAGETVNVGTQMPTATMDVTGGGDVAPLPVESENAKTPGYAFLLELGGDPEEIITIPGAGRFGGVKQVPAWQLMDMRLKEIGQPLIDRKAIQKQTEASEAVKTKAAQFRGQ